MRVINRCPSAAFSLLYVDILRAAKTSPPASSRRAASRQRRQFSCLLMLSDCSNQAPSCRAVGKAPDPDQKQQRESKTLHRRSPLMNACIHNAEGREINESVWFGGETQQDLIAWPSRTVAPGDAKMLGKAGQTSRPLPFRSICEKQKAIESGNICLKARPTPKARRQKNKVALFLFSKAEPTSAKNR